MPGLASVTIIFSCGGGGILHSKLAIPSSILEAVPFELKLFAQSIQ
uniref:Uncharacterized protein n=1 Tax=Rhizophora mucronata TaxID=61149 RepID=A0A2P2MYR3_RHIMU